MSCNCTQVCDIAKCAETIIVGTIDPEITVIVQFKDTVTGRIKQVQATSDEDGLLIADVSLISAFFSENLVYEVTILASNANQCNTESWSIGDTEGVECVTLKFVNIDLGDETEVELSVQE